MDYSIKEDTVEYIFGKIKLLIVPSENNNYKSRFLQSNILLYCVVLLLILKIFAVLISINLPQNIFFADITKSSLENFVNQTRQSLGLEPLSENQKLDQAAELKAENMVQNQYFNHTSPSGVTPWFWFLKAGYNYKYAGENLAIGFYDSKEVYDAWLNSPSHKTNITNPNYTEVGTAVLSGFGQNNTIVVVQEFGSQLPVKPVVVKNNNLKSTAATAENPEPSLTNGANGKVLSQTTEAQNSIESPTSNSTNNTSSKLLNYVLYNYEVILQDIIYGISLVVIGILLTLIFFNFNISFKKQLIFRTVLIVVLLSVATLLNKELIISFIPHQILI
jgi:hypothetical protein